ncbi:hypothetical protein LVJ94_27690 [Pendulispora rubella]|uniref:Cell wall protein n=1 Tax=Pendulispora rubella TaxID=2741070 RepID=A0ABZ2KQ91_9BACT
MKHLKLAVVASTAAGAALLACGGLSDPSRQEGSLSLSGSLSGTALPNGAHVALVWRSGASGNVTIAADAPVVNGQYSLTVETPPDGYFFTDDDDGTDAGPPPTGSSPGDLGLGTQGESVGGQVTDPLSRAVAGFLVYVDKNGDDELDADDTILGGDRELSLTYFRGGASLSYEKLRDKTGALPHAGFNLGWTEGWLQFDNADLTLSSKAELPGIVCGGGLGPRPFPDAGTFDSGTGTFDAGRFDSGTGGQDSGGGTGSGYPDPNDPRLHCRADGRSYSYDPICQTVPRTLCSLHPAAQCEGVYGSGIPTGFPIPVGWPCPIPGEDAGAPPQGGGSGAP